MRANLADIDDILNDDIVMKKKSALPLSNLVFKPTIVSGGTTWNPTLKVDYLKSEEEYTWPNVISVPGSRFDNATANLTCNEKR